jgi:hypothetical protein
VRSGPTEVLLTRLLPTDEKSLEKFSFIGRPPGSEVYDNMLKAKDVKFEHVLGVLREYKTSPVTQEMYSMLIQSQQKMNLTKTQLEQLIEGYVDSSKIWGDRWSGRIEFSIGVGLINGRQYSSLAFEHLDAAEKLMGEDLSFFKDAIVAYRDTAKVNVHVQQILEEGTNDETKAKSYEELTEVYKRQPYNGEVLNALSTYAQKSGKTDAAIEYLTQISAIPMLEITLLRMRAGLPPDTPTPTEQLKKLWAEKHGSEEGCIAHVDAAYHKMIDNLMADCLEHMPALPADKLGNRATLVELFTGMLCPPCVAADLSLMALNKTYGPDHLIILRFHQHIPSADGLVNQDSEERAAYYEINSTPSIAVDGIPTDPKFYSGPTQMAPNTYRSLRRMVDTRMVQSTDAKVNVKADLVDGQLSVSAEVTGIPDDVLESCRLRMAVVENQVFAYAPLMSNGIREHEYVVREMLGGAKGIPPRKGELKYSVTIPLADINQRVVDHISRFEAGRRFEFPADLKPGIKGPLSVVAWVQNGNIDKDTNAKMVIQAALVPVGGDAVTSESVSGKGSESPESPATEAPAKETPAVEGKPEKADAPAAPAVPE